MTVTRSPGASDYQRAAALFLHRHRYDVEGVNAVLLEAEGDDRLTEMILALLNIARMAPVPLATGEGVAGLQAIALHMLEAGDP
ncbi:hypothetical protein [Gordonia tangerina]|uniref:Uncharacterized protein n=1 Tax=Gordonia tangerina TaxID=2911060 RepID=A0ABS9DLC7_9ACTN|nr:hypothetical protein [Gordonia tangerina]MCF3939074.1 hypothetical protein [Gordonia tangerina]